LMMNAKTLFSVFFVSIWKDINVIKKFKKLHPCHLKGHQKNTKRNSNIPHLR